MQKDNNLDLFLNLLLVVALIISLNGFIVDIRNSIKSGGVDLRPRVTGARAIIEGINPYYFKSIELPVDKRDLFFEPLEYLSKSELKKQGISKPEIPVSRVNVTPSFLILHMPTAYLPYNIQRMIWTILQWIFLLLSLLLFAKTSDSKEKAKLIWIIGLLFISGSYAWHFHVERGQQYIFYVFLVAFAYWLWKKPFKWSTFLSGFIIGVTASFRFPIFFLLIPLLLNKKWKSIAGGVSGLSFSVLLSIIITHIYLPDLFLWEEYFSSLQWQFKIHLSFEMPNDPLLYPVNPYDLIKYGLDRYRIVEGVNLANFLHFEHTDSSFRKIILFLGHKPTLIGFQRGLTIGLFSTLGVISYFLFKYRLKEAPVQLLYLVGAALVCLSEFYIPVSRAGYYDVIWLLPLSLIIINLDSILSLLKSKLTILFIFGLLLFNGYTWVWPEKILLGVLSLLLYVLIFTAVLYRKKWLKENHL